MAKLDFKIEDTTEPPAEKRVVPTNEALLALLTSLKPGKNVLIPADAFDPGTVRLHIGREAKTRTAGKLVTRSDRKAGGLRVYCV